MTSDVTAHTVLSADQGMAVRCSSSPRFVRGGPLEGGRAAATHLERGRDDCPKRAATSYGTGGLSETHSFCRTVSHQ
eukprot:CAMPEP_0172908218 /NCGR_PEP_ID=MMETSP1075-20121228/180289_1 /TAXON_ID=2916 /ORGANISM="Ceratium fusus, Strain PA161109" /LENGTH=76 /DNA_ID=CAMNT_0013765945 /DNA_START=89 /DNA_END=319 /DNA_ORIENTATION=-